MSWYRLRVNWKYSRTQDANAAATAIDDVLIAAGRPERCTKPNNTTVDLTIDEISSQALAESLRDQLMPAWNRGTRSENKASLVLRDESSR